MKRLVAAMLMASSVAACATPKAAPLQSGAGLQGQNIAYVNRPLPTFSATKSSKAAVGALFGAVGGMAMAMNAMSEGHVLVTENQVPDPSAEISVKLTQALADKYGAKVAAPVAPPASGKVPYSQIANGNPYIIDVQTQLWQVSYYPTVWNHYQAWYSGKASLIDTRTNKVLASGVCFKKSPETADVSPTYDEFVANRAERLKVEMRKLTDQCYDYFRTEVFKL